MNTRRFRDLVPGGSISASDRNRFNRQVAALSRIRGPGVSASMAGVQIRRPGPDWFWAVLTHRDDSGEEPVYHWRRVQHQADGPGRVIRVEDTSFSGTPDYLPAVEAAGATVEVPTVVKLRRGVGDFYVFRCGCQGAGSGRGSGDDGEGSGSGSGSGSGILCVGCTVPVSMPFTYEDSCRINTGTLTYNPAIPYDDVGIDPYSGTGSPGEFEGWISDEEFEYDGDCVSPGFPPILWSHTTTYRFVFACPGSPMDPDSFAFGVIITRTVTGEVYPPTLRSFTNRLYLLAPFDSTTCDCWRVQPGPTNNAGLFCPTPVAGDCLVSPSVYCIAVNCECEEDGTLYSCVDGECVEDPGGVSLEDCLAECLTP